MKYRRRKYQVIAEQEKSVTTSLSILISDSGLNIKHSDIQYHFFIILYF